MSTYEAMFLLNPALATDWSAAEAEVRRLLDRAGATVLALKRWDERKLAYEIGGQKRGVFGLLFFEAAGDRIAGLEHDARLSEMVMRLLVLRAEGMTTEKIDAVMACAAPSKSVDRGEGWGGGRERAPRHAEPAMASRAAEEPDAGVGRAGAPDKELDTAEAR